MAGVPDKVLNWLYSVLPSEYKDVNRTYHDVVETLSHYPSLAPRTEVYTYENGASALLLQLHGTLPVTFRDQTYGFPLTIWVPHAYPRESPLVYITPSQDMLVRPGQHVSGDGRVYHPYLAQWGKYWDKSTVFDFLAVLKGVFAKEPPVRSKQQPQHHYHAPAAQAPPPVPPTPVEWRRSVQSTPVASPSPGGPSGAPIPPPKPPKPYEQSRASPQPQVQKDRYSQPPPLPPHPPQQPQLQDRYQQGHQQAPRNSYAGQHNWQQGPPPPHAPPQNVTQRQAGYDISPAIPVSRPMRPQVQAQGHPSHQSYELGSPVSPITPEDQRSRYQNPAPPPHQQPTNFLGPSHQQPPPPHIQQQQQQQHHYAAVPAQPPFHQHPPQTHAPQQYPQHSYPPQQPAQPKPAPPPPNLLDDDLTVTLPSQKGPQAPLPVPPVPPNPEKDALLHALSTTLTAQINQIIEQNNAAIAPLQSQQAALQTAYARLQAELEQLQQLDAALANNEKVLRDTMVEADRVMDDARRRKAPDVDDVLVAPTVVGGQLYTIAAEERGIAEALFMLGKAFDRGRVGADVFVKQTRSLAREQFLKKALLKKISRGMGLDEYAMR